MIETTSYAIKTYSPEFFDEEVKLVREFEERKGLNEIYRTLQSEAQVNGLKNFREGAFPNFPFIPEDHYYLFDGDEMVGFIHSFPQQNTKRCTISIVFTKEGHEAGEELLFNHMLKAVKDKGYNTLVRNTSDDHTIELEFLEKFGFEKTRLRNCKAIMNIVDLNLELTDQYIILPYDDDKHREELINNLYLNKGYTKEQMEQQFDNTIKARDNGNVPSWIVATEDGNLIGGSVAFYGKPHIEDLIQFNTVTTNLEGDASIPLIKTIYGSHIKNLPDKITRVEHYFMNQVIHLRETYEKIGFDYIENHLYEKAI